MNEIKCPQCGKVFQIDESDYDSIVKQIRDKEFEHEISSREEHYKIDKENAVKLAEAHIKEELSNAISKKDLEINELRSKLENLKTQNELEIQKAVAEKERRIDSLSNEIDKKNTEYELKEKSMIETYESKMKDKDEQIAYYKDLKARSSTKMIGESLEQHCSTEFNRVRPLFQNCYFEKDNDAKTGSKGDFIFRYYADEGMQQELVSIMFEMKNEADTTATKHKNEDFFKELDKDRKEKKCEYAVLVSLLEMDNDLYNDGIVDVSHKYEKMYVIRPQFFVPIITLITNLAKKSLDYKKELELVRTQNIDITNFEENLTAFKQNFARNYKLASDKFQKAIEEIDKTIDHLQKTKEALLSSENNLRIANNKADDITIKKLTNNAPAVRQMFKELDGENDN